MANDATREGECVEGEACGICGLMARYDADRSQVRVVYESDEVLAVHSTKPFAQVHVFIMAKRHIPTVFDMTEADIPLQNEMWNAIRAAAREVIAMLGACRVEMYLGEFQNTKHVHCHVVYDPAID